MTIAQESDELTLILLHGAAVAEECVNTIDELLASVAWHGPAASAARHCSHRRTIRAALLADDLRMLAQLASTIGGGLGRAQTGLH